MLSATTTHCRCPAAPAADDQERVASASQFIFRSDDSIIGEQVFRVSPGDLDPGTYIFAVFNMNYFRHQTFLYELEVPRPPRLAWITAIQPRPCPCSCR